MGEPVFHCPVSTFRQQGCDVMVEGKGPKGCVAAWADIGGINQSLILVSLTQVLFCLVVLTRPMHDTTST